ncbi:MAG: Gfo/Idh/MocA family oxidoreductase [Methylacidiphilales bacterium]|nr:Gfo/Idh/MocA family oxidoreductase [Candidatus Methylacidiphilales bacterium]
MSITYNYEYSRKLRVCFIGAGQHAFRNIFPTFAFAPVELTAVCDLDPERAGNCARLFGALRTYTSHLEMLAKEKPDLVFIVTSYDAQGLPVYPALAMDCLRAGAHAWIEKPPAGTSAEIREMMRVSAETGRHVAVGLKKMFFPANLKAKGLSERPSFGRINCITARYPQQLPPHEERADNHKMVYFLDHMVHPHSVLLLLGGPLESLFVTRSASGAATVSLRFKSGAIGNLILSHGQSGSSFFERTEIIGEGENVVVDNNIRVTLYRSGRQTAGYGRSGDYFSLYEDESGPLHWEPEFSLGQLHNKGLFLLGYAPEVIHYTTRLLEGKGPEYGTLEDALEMLLIYEAYRKPDGHVHFIGK